MVDIDAGAVAERIGGNPMELLIKSADHFNQFACKKMPTPEEYPGALHSMVVDAMVDAYLMGQKMPQAPVPPANVDVGRRIAVQALLEEIEEAVPAKFRPESLQQAIAAARSLFK